MATGLLKAADVNDVVGIAELGALILGFLDDIDLRSASLTNKRFNCAAQVHLWRAIRLPYLLPKHDSADKEAFWVRFADPLARRTLSLSVDLRVAAESLFNHISLMPRWESNTTDPAARMIKQETDEFFEGLKAILLQMQHLRSFTARNVPRVFDLVLLVQQNRSEIESLNITASNRDTFGLRLIPTHDMARWNNDPQNNPGMAAPLASLVNLGAGNINLAPEFNFPNPRFLSLNNIQFDCRRPSLFVDPLVAILKGSPGLKHLELSLRHQLGGFDADGHFHQEHSTNNHFMETLCLQYAAAGGQPLILSTLRLGYGCEIVDRGWVHTNAPHYISSLLDPARLEELHMEQPTHKDGTNYRLWSQFGFTLVSSKEYPTERCMTSVRKITMPWGGGRLLEYLHKSSDEHLEHIILRVDRPVPTDFRINSHPSWVSGALHVHTRYNRNLTLKGLVLPTDSMSPKDADYLLSFIPWIQPMESLKIRMPSLTPEKKGSEEHDGRRAFYRRLKHMTTLRELWLADGQGKWDKPSKGQPWQFIKQRYPTEAEFRRFSRLIAEKCPSLEYLRILDRAWIITRPDANSKKPKLRELMAWEVDRSVPEAFNFEKPKQGLLKF